MDGLKNDHADQQPFWVYTIGQVLGVQQAFRKKLDGCIQDR